MSAADREPGAADDRGDERAALVRALLEGRLAAEETEERVAACGIAPSGRYTALRGRDAHAGALRRAVERGPGACLTAFVGGELWALATTVPAIGSGDGVVGAGPAATLAAAHVSFGLATRALRTAEAFGLSGLVRFDDLSLLPAVVEDDEVGERAVARYLEPLAELGDFGDTLEQTLRAYLDSGMRGDETASALIVHPNTLRYRLERFRELTGANLRRTEDLVAIWWALERRRLDRGRGA